MLLESASQVYGSKNTKLGKFSNGMEKIYFSLFDRIVFEIFTHFSIVWTIFGPFGLIFVVGARFERVLTESLIYSC